ncbi:MAG: restriction endonuclease subunit S [Bacteroidetes bacterium]|nr:restriction endonuclease subunit S [Bacteroidota bacterium]
MNNNFPKYPAYKPSGVEWLGEIPTHWETLSNKYIFRLKKNRVGKKFGDYVLLSLTLNGVIKRDMENPQGKFPAEYDTYQEVSKGDFIFCLFDVEETPRTVGLSDSDGMITGAYTVMQPNDNFDKGFLYYFYLNLDADKRLKPLYTGLRNTISKENFFSFKTFVPLFEEQTAIAQFLDRKTTLIDQAIGIKEKQIELLKERRQILIHKAVTLGLNPDVKMKESGVEWIGEVPEHWEVIANRGLFDERNEPGNATLNILSVSIHTAVSSEELSDEENLRGKIRIDDKRNYKLVKPNDIAFNMMRAWQGAIGAVRVDGMVSPAYIVAKPKRKVNADYLEYLFRTKDFIGQMDRHSKGITDFRKRLYWNEFKQLKITFPPIEEQNAIVNYIYSFSNKITNAVSLKGKEIEKLKEYKATLINSVVTGKIKVF